MDSQTRAWLMVGYTEGGAVLQQQPTAPAREPSRELPRTGRRGSADAAAARLMVAAAVADVQRASAAPSGSFASSEGSLLSASVGHAQAGLLSRAASMLPSSSRVQGFQPWAKPTASPQGASLEFSWLTDLTDVGGAPLPPTLGDSQLAALVNSWELDVFQLSATELCKVTYTMFELTGVHEADLVDRPLLWNFILEAGAHAAAARAQRAPPPTAAPSLFGPTPLLAAPFQPLC